jgi:hypothetical protein
MNRPPPEQGREDGGGGGRVRNACFRDGARYEVWVSGVLPELMCYRLFRRRGEDRGRRDCFAFGSWDGEGWAFGLGLGDGRRAL